MNRACFPVVAMLGVWSVLVPARADDPKKPDVWAIVVGIDRCDDIAIPRCSGAVRDARRVAEWFVRDAGWGETSVLRMDDLGKQAHGTPDALSPPLRPSRANLDWAI